MHLRARQCDSDVEELSSARLQCLIKGTTQHMHPPTSQLPLTPNLNCVRSDAKRFEIRASHIPFLNAEKADSSWWETWICLPFNFLDYKWLPHKAVTLWSFRGKLIASFIITYALERVDARSRFQINTAEWFNGVFLCIELTHDFKNKIRPWTYGQILA